VHSKPSFRDRYRHNSVCCYWFFVARRPFIAGDIIKDPCRVDGDRLGIGLGGSGSIILYILRTGSAYRSGGGSCSYAAFSRLWLAARCRQLFLGVWGFVSISGQFDFDQPSWSCNLPSSGNRAQNMVGGKEGKESHFARYRGLGVIIGNINIYYIIIPTMIISNSFVHHPHHTACQHHRPVEVPTRPGGVHEDLVHQHWRAVGLGAT